MHRRHWPRQSLLSKLGELSFEAVKFALAILLARVATEPPKHQGSHIRSIHFDGGILDGQTLHFSPELTR